MTDQQKGFNIYGKFFPFVAYEDWLNRDFPLAREMTGVPTEQLFSDPMLLEQALIGVAVWHESPLMDRGEVAAYVGNLKPGDAEEVGFDALPERPSPLTGDEPSSNGSSSSATSGESSEPTPEISPTGSSGTHGSDTGSQG